MLWQIVITLSTAPPPFKPLSCHTIGLHLSEKVQKMRRRVAEKPNHFSETTASQIQIPPPFISHIDHVFRVSFWFNYKQFDN